MIELEENIDGSDLSFLRSKFVEMFKFEDNSGITFQRHDPEWDCYVDLDEGAEVYNKDRLKAVFHSQEEVSQLSQPVNDFNKEPEVIV